MIRYAINRYQKRAISLNSGTPTDFKKSPDRVSLWQHLPKKELKSRNLVQPYGSFYC